MVFGKKRKKPRQAEIRQVEPRPWMTSRPADLNRKRFFSYPQTPERAEEAEEMRAVRVSVAADTVMETGVTQTLSDIGARVSGHINPSGNPVIIISTTDMWLALQAGARFAPDCRTTGPMQPAEKGFTYSLAIAPMGW